MSIVDLKKYEVTRTDTGVMKAVAMALMVFHHGFLQMDRLSNGNGYDSLFILSDGNQLEPMLAFFGKLCVGLFMLLSGFGICKSYMQKSEAEAPSYMSAMIGKRIRGIFIRWWQVLAVFIPLAYIIKAEASNQSLVDWLKSVFFIDFKPNTEVWFAPPYILMMFMIPFVVRWFARKHANVWSDGLLIIVINALCLTGVPQFFDSMECFNDFRNTYFYSQTIMMIALLPTFLAGWYLAKYQLIEKIRAYFNGRLVGRLVGLILIYLTFFFRARNYIGTRYSWDYFDFMYAATFMIGVLLLIDGLNKLKEYVGFVGKYSTGMWMTHSFFCFYYFQDFTYETRNPIVIFLVIYLFSFLTSFIITEGFGFLWRVLKQMNEKAENKRKENRDETDD